VTIYEAKITEINKRESEFQGNVTIFFMTSIENIKLGPKLKKAADYSDKDIEMIENLKVRISEKLQNENNFKKGDMISFSGRLVKDNFWGYTIKNVRKITKK
ncbi:MAG: hypothetical protein ACFFDH_24630, partial [Promethearchaeota archaeon]